MPYCNAQWQNYSQRAPTDNFNRGNSKLPGGGIVNRRLQNPPNRYRRKQPPVGGQPPAAPSPQGQRGEQYSRPCTPYAHAAALYNPAIFHVFRKFCPLRLRRLTNSALPATLLETPHPDAFLQPQRAQVAAHKAPPKNSPRQLAQRSRLQRANMSNWHLGRVANGFHSHSPLLPCPPQLLAECRHTALSRHALRHTAATFTLCDCSSQIKGIWPDPPAPEPA